MKVLITGAGGQVGKEIMQIKKNFDIQLIGLKHNELDVTDSVSILKALNTHLPDLLINAAAYTDVEKAESEMELAYDVNRLGAKKIAEICFDRRIPLIHLSTDYVFDGKKKQPYTEWDTENPINTYGRSKFEGEVAIRSILNKHLILRTRWVFGVYGKNFVKTMLRLQKNGDPLQLISDTYGCPSGAADIAMVIMRLAYIINKNKGIKWGTYHYCGDHSTNWYSFAKEIFEEVSKVTGQPIPKILPISAKYYSPALQRPVNTALNCEKIEETFNIKPCHWKKGVNEVVNSLLKTEKCKVN